MALPDETEQSRKRTWSKLLEKGRLEKIELRANELYKYIYSHRESGERKRKHGAEYGRERQPEPRHMRKHLMHFSSPNGCTAISGMPAFLLCTRTYLSLLRSLLFFRFFFLFLAETVETMRFLLLHRFYSVFYFLRQTYLRKNLNIIQFYSKLLFMGMLLLLVFHCRWPVRLFSGDHAVYCFRISWFYLLRELNMLTALEKVLDITRFSFFYVLFTL